MQPYLVNILGKLLPGQYDLTFLFASKMAAPAPNPFSGLGARNVFC